MIEALTKGQLKTSKIQIISLHSPSLSFLKLGSQAMLSNLFSFKLYPREFEINEHFNLFHGLPLLMGH